MQSIDAYTRHQIEKSDQFICLLPLTPFEGTEGDAHLRYAISLRKHIVVWRLTDRSYLPIPKALADYDDYIIVDGAEDDMCDALLQYREASTGDEILFHTGIWGKGYYQ